MSTTEEKNAPFISNWDELELDNQILRGIYAYGFEKPSPIQQKAIKPIIDNQDVVAQAQSGTGKTATFSIGALTKINLKENTTQVMILSPTRELSMQTAKVISSIGHFLDGLNVQTLVGGTHFERGNSFSSRNKHVPHVVCGCPGRVNDMLSRGVIHGNTVKLIILDEADEMLSFGFQSQVYNIFQHLSDAVQVCLFSATIPENVNDIVSKITRNALKITVRLEQLTLEGISQYYIAVNDDRQKYDALKNLFSFLTLSHTIIYCNSIQRVQDLYEAMSEDRFPVCRLHSNMDKGERDRSFNEFKSGTSRVLISSNVTARGIDIQQVSVVINFDIPKCVNTYLHRIGRSGRWGRKGIAVNFITSRDVQAMKKIEEYYSTQINEMPQDFQFLSKL